MPLEQKQGIILKGLGGFYFVVDQNAQDQVYTCRLRGKLRRHDGGVLVGDRVLFAPLNEAEGVVEEILPRQNQLIRPKVANIEQAVLIFAAASPEPDWLLLDRLLIFCHQAGITPRICFNKEDIAAEELKMGAEIYQKAGFDVLLVSAFLGRGKEEIQKWLAGRVSIVAGPSGVGKSSLLNMVEPGFALETGDISTKLGRGRHTTRLVELFPLSSGGWVADTPGFSLLDMPKEMRPEDLAAAYPEMRQAKPCRFDGCLHHKEPGCTIREMVAENEIQQERYQRYLYLLDELQKREERYYD